jgi:hypothetical protein
MVEKTKLIWAFGQPPILKFIKSLPKVGLPSGKFTIAAAQSGLPCQNLSSDEIVVADYGEFDLALSSRGWEFTRHFLDAAAAGPLLVLKNQLDFVLPDPFGIVPKKRVILAKPLFAILHADSTMQASEFFYSDRWFLLRISELVTELELSYH